MDRLLLPVEPLLPLILEAPPCPSRSWIEVNATAFAANISLIKQLVKNHLITLVVKSNAYGHGMELIAKLGELNPFVDALATATIEEAVTLRKTGITKPIVALYEPGDDFTQAFKEDIQLGVYSYRMLNAVVQAAKAYGTKAVVHLKIDTGLGRMGISSPELGYFMSNFSKAPLIVAGIFTHLADKNNGDESFTQKQLQCFEQAFLIFKGAGYEIPFVHALSSNSLHLSTRYPFLTMARVGAHAYGLTYSHQDMKALRAVIPNALLAPVLSWKTKLMQIKEVPKGTFVGYERTYKTDSPARIGILPIGYADGLPRGLSNKGFILIQNKQVPVIGIVSMNLTTVDVTALDNPMAGEEVTLIGPGPGMSAYDQAALCGTVSLEVTTRLERSIHRTLAC